MTDLPPDAPPPTPVKPARKSLLERLSIVWLIPALALAVALGVAWNSYAQRGPLVELLSDSASGIKAGQTELRYREVTVGVVEDVSFTEGLGRVLVKVRLDKEVEDYVDGDAKFWVVQPRVTPQGVTGLTTVLSGVYIEGLWDDRPGGLVERHDLSPDTPLNGEGRDGLQIRLRASGDTGLTEGAPLVYRGIEVGRIGKAEIAADGDTVEADAIIFAPRDRLISSATRFWDSSGVRFSLGPGGARVDFSSLAALVSGGVTFQTVVSGGTSVAPGTLFEVYADEESARSSVFARDRGEVLTLSAIFEENVSGLTVGAPVTLGGLRVGEVTALNGIVDEARFGDDHVRLATTLTIEPGQFGIADSATPDDALDYLDEQVQDGLRLRLSTASILTGRLKLDLVEIEDAPPARIDRTSGPNPIIPTTESEISDVSASAEDIYRRVNALPIEDLMQSAIATLDNVSNLLGSQEIRAVPGDVRALLDDARGFVGSDEVQAIPARISGAAGELEALIAQLNQSNAAGQLAAALDSAAAAAASVNDATAGLPGLVERLNGVAATANDLPLNELVARTSALIDSLDQLVGSDDTRALPGDLSAALDELRRVLQVLREGGLIENANATLASARTAADDISAAASDLPGVLRQTEVVLNEAAQTIRGYDANQGVGRNLDLAIREVQRAAAAIASLAREIERSPNSLLFGR